MRRGERALAEGRRARRENRFGDLERKSPVSGRLRLAKGWECCCGGLNFSSKWRGVLLPLVGQHQQALSRAERCDSVVNRGAALLSHVSAAVVARQLQLTRRSEHHVISHPSRVSVRHDIWLRDGMAVLGTDNHLHFSALSLCFSPARGERLIQLRVFTAISHFPRTLSAPIDYRSFTGS